jgi:peptidoglycan hydrolase CwlO-like protein
MKKMTLATMMMALLITACGETKTQKEISSRKAALAEHQKTELKKAQDELWKTDSLLQLANKQLEAMTQEVEAHKKELKATPEELTALTKLRVKRDSIRTQYEALGLKIRYIHKKQSEE